MADYIHRSGRTGRVSGKHGYVTTFITTPEAVDILHQLERAVRMNQSIGNVDANIRRWYNEQYEQKQKGDLKDKEYEEEDEDLRDLPFIELEQRHDMSV